MGCSILSLCFSIITSSFIFAAETSKQESHYYKDVPPEMWARIISFIDYSKNKLVIFTLNKSLHDLSKNIFFWNILYGLDFGGKTANGGEDSKDNYLQAFKGLPNDEIEQFNYASKFGHTVILKKLLKKGIDINKKSSNGFSILYAAAEHGHHDVVLELLNNNPTLSIFADNYTPIYIAAQNGHLQCLQHLCKKFPQKIDPVSPNRANALYVAAQNGHLSCVQALLNLGARVDIAFDPGNYYPMYIAAQKGYLEVIQALYEKGAPIDSITSKGATPLYIAAQMGFLDIVRFLVNKGANINHQFSNGYTPAHIAIQEKHPSIVEFLIKAGADVALVSNEGKTIFDLAKGTNCEELEKILSPYFPDKI